MTKKFSAPIKREQLWEEEVSVDPSQKEEILPEIRIKKSSRGMSYGVDLHTVNLCLLVHYHGTEERWPEAEQMVERTLEKLTSWFLRAEKGLENKDIQSTSKKAGGD